MSTKKKTEKPVKLIPPDPKHCQRTFLEGAWPDAQHFMVIGPRRLRQCNKKPTLIVTEKVPNPDDGQCGSMSMCASCWEDYKKMGNESCVSVTVITS